MSIISDVINKNTTGDALIDAIQNEVTPTIVELKPQETKADHEPLEWLTTVNDYLEQIPETWLGIFLQLNTIATGVPQAYVDAVCRRMAWRVNITVERLRQWIIKSLYEENKCAKAIIDILNFAKKVITDPIGTIGGFFSRLVSPITIAIQVIAKLAVEVPRLAKNIAMIADALPPEPINPDINFDEFTNNLELGKIDLNSIASPEDMPPPEVIFPEPPKVWGKGVFNAVFEEGTGYSFKKDKTKEIKYSPDVPFAKNSILQEQLKLEGILVEAAMDYTKSKSSI